MTDANNHAKRFPDLPHPHFGMRKFKSLLAVFVGFCLWQLIRLVIPGLEVHPIFIYVYGMIEIRETSDKTRDYGKQRIIATFVAIAIGIPFMALLDLGEAWMDSRWHIYFEIAMLLIGAFLVLTLAEIVKCRVYCGLAAAIYIILMVSHIDSSMYLYSVMRAFQTIIGVSIAWLINVKLLPYPPTPGSVSYYLQERKEKKPRQQKSDLP